jgi:organic hydroperoxide reductase OsmC/OhrA
MIPRSMADEEIPSGKNERVSQADGAAPSRPGSAPAPSSASPAEAVEHGFTASAVWSGDGTGSGHVRLAGGAIDVPIAGATVLGGAGGAANPEELLLGAVAACFVNTWAIFLRKLQVGYAEPAVRVAGTLSNDPAGGFRMTAAVIYARVPASLLEGDRAKVEKTLSLAEKYCIISKVAKAAMPLKVEIEPV